jgi:predicted transcriptional regulator
MSEEQSINRGELLALTSEIVSAYLSNNPVARADVVVASLSAAFHITKTSEPTHARNRIVVAARDLAEAEGSHRATISCASGSRSLRMVLRRCTVEDRCL